MSSEQLKAATKAFLFEELSMSGFKVMNFLDEDQYLTEEEIADWRAWLRQAPEHGISGPQSYAAAVLLKRGAIGPADCDFKWFRSTLTESKKQAQSKRQLERGALYRKLERLADCDAHMIDSRGREWEVWGDGLHDPERNQSLPWGRLKSPQLHAVISRAEAWTREQPPAEFVEADWKWLKRHCRQPKGFEKPLRVALPGVTISGDGPARPDAEHVGQDGGRAAHPDPGADQG